MTGRHRRCPLQGDVQVAWSRSPQSTVVVAVLRVASGGTAQIAPLGQSAPAPTGLLLRPIRVGY